MNIYHVKRHGGWDWDQYTDFVCVAPDELSARRMHPAGNLETTNSAGIFTGTSSWSWVCDPAELHVTLIGTALNQTQRIVCASFNAG